LAQISPETAIRYQMETNRERTISQEEEEDLWEKGKSLLFTKALQVFAKSKRM